MAQGSQHFQMLLGAGAAGVILTLVAAMISELVAITQTLFLIRLCGCWTACRRLCALEYPLQLEVQFRTLSDAVSDWCT